MMRTSSTLDPSGRRTIQSPPGSTVPLSFGPSNVPPDTGTITRFTPIDPMLFAGCVSRIRSINSSDGSPGSAAGDCAPAPADPAAAMHKEVNARLEMSDILKHRNRVEREAGAAGDRHRVDRQHELPAVQARRSFAERFEILVVQQVDAEAGN